MSAKKSSIGPLGSVASDVDGSNVVVSSTNVGEESLCLVKESTPMFYLGETLWSMGSLAEVA